MKTNSRFIVVDRNRFALLIKSYRKSLHIINLLTYICRSQNVDVTLKIEEVCQVLEIDPRTLDKFRSNGNIKSTSTGSLCLYEISDIVRLKVASEMADIYRMINDASVSARERK